MFLPVLTVPSIFFRYQQVPIQNPVFNFLPVDLSVGQFSERCDVDGSFFNSDAIPITFGKA